MIKWGCYSAVEGHQKDTLNASVNLAQLGGLTEIPDFNSDFVSPVKNWEKLSLSLCLEAQRSSVRPRVCAASHSDKAQQPAWRLVPASQLRCFLRCHIVGSSPRTPPPWSTTT